MSRLPAAVATSYRIPRPRRAPGGVDERIGWPPVPTGIKFRLLGPVEVTRGQQVVTPRAHKVRVLLAALLVRSNVVVPVDALIRVPWENEPPRTALQATRVPDRHLDSAQLFRHAVEVGRRVPAQVGGVAQPVRQHLGVGLRRRTRQVVRYGRHPSLLPLLCRAKPRCPAKPRCQRRIKPV
ncbi:MAG TPA: hypothetical protein VFE14_14980 [Micromonosporaceae bacterium]|jgi:hypothetical protein|nr:hypothetical protein [Micromonosporaceae bacterium]